MEYRRGRITQEYRLGSERELHDYPCPISTRRTFPATQWAFVELQGASYGEHERGFVDTRCR